MASLSIQSFGVGNQSLQTLLPQHEKTLQEILAPIVKKNIHLFEGAGSYRYSIGQDRVTFVSSTGKKIEVTLGKKEGTETAKKTERLVNFYRHTGHLEREKLDPKEQNAHFLKTCETVESMRKQAIPGAKGKILSVTAITENTLSIGRNVLGLVLGPNNPISSHLAYPAGCIWTGYGILETYRGKQDYERASTIGDDEGRRRAAGRISCGTIATGASIFYLAGKVCQSAEAGSSAIAGVGMTAGSLFGISSVLGIGLSSLGILRCHRFLETLKVYDDDSLKEEERVGGSLHYLWEQCTITVGDKRKILQEIRASHPDLGPKERQALLEEKIGHLLEKKIKYLKRRTSNAGLQLIVAKVGEILSKIESEDPSVRHKALIEGRKLLLELKGETHKKMRIFAISLFASSLSLIAFITGTVFSMGALPLALYAISGAIYLIITLYQFGFQLLKKDPELAGNILQPEPLLVH